MAFDTGALWVFCARIASSFGWHIAAISEPTGPAREAPDRDLLGLGGLAFGLAPLVAAMLRGQQAAWAEAAFMQRMTDFYDAAVAHDPRHCAHQGSHSAV